MSDSTVAKEESTEPAESIEKKLPPGVHEAAKAGGMRVSKHRERPAKDESATPQARVVAGLAPLPTATVGAGNSTALATPSSHTSIAALLQPKEIPSTYAPPAPTHDRAPHKASQAGGRGHGGTPIMQPSGKSH